MIGWKAGFGSPAALARLGIERPLVAPLPARGVLDDGATVDVSGWTSPVLEAEVAVWIGQGLGVAIELADVDVPPDGVERILASGIYHRHVLLGPPVAQALDGFSARVLCDGDVVASTGDPTALTGELDDVLEAVRLTAGRELCEGEVVIAGSVVPPLPLTTGGWLADLGRLGSLSVTIGR